MVAFKQFKEVSGRFLKEAAQNLLPLWACGTETARANLKKFFASFQKEAFLLMSTCVRKNHVRRLFADHDDRGVGVRRDETRHDGTVDDADRLGAVQFQRR
jgi:hypothetical protein